MLMRQHLVACRCRWSRCRRSLRPLVAAGLAKDPGRRPADGAALVAGLRTVGRAGLWPGVGGPRPVHGWPRPRCCWPRCGRRAARPPCRAAPCTGSRLRLRLPHGHVSMAKAAIMAGM